MLGLVKDGPMAWITGSGPVSPALLDAAAKSSTDLSSAAPDLARRSKPLSDARKTVEALSRKEGTLRVEDAIKTSKVFHSVDIHMRQVKNGWQ